MVATAMPAWLTVVLSVGLAFASEGGLRTELTYRRLSTEAEDDSYHWGKCDKWTEEITGCNLTSGLVCSSHLSDGPADSDVEIGLTNLPPSTVDNEVHLQWWAPKKSIYPYSPWVSPRGCAVYRDMRKAYPTFGSEGYNGGNVRVNETGHAMIRVRQPATYRVDQWILYPHIHFRFCRGDAAVSVFSDTIFFTPMGVMLVQGEFHGSERSHLMEHDPTFDATFTTTTTFEVDELASANSEDEDLLDNTSGLVDFRIQDAKEALDLDALEFSPVYHCLLAGDFYSYSQSGCVDTCPANTEVHVGQCVRAKKLDAEPVKIEATWLLQLQSGAVCFHDKLTVTLHHVRLAVADHLNIPFQEVVEVSLLDYVLADRRRLTGDDDDDGEIRAVKLHVVVESSRFAPSHGDAFLGTLINEASDASFFLGFEVHTVKLLPNGDDINDGKEIAKVGSESDPYAEAYEGAARERDGVPIPGIQGGSIPVELVFVLAGAVLLGFGLLAAILIFFRRRRPGEPITVAGYVIAGPTGNRPTTAPKTMGNPTQDDDDDLKKPQKESPPAPQAMSGPGAASGGLGLAPQEATSGTAAIAPSAATTLGVSPPDELAGAGGDEGQNEQARV